MMNKYIRGGVIAALTVLSSAAFAAPTSEWGYVGAFQGSLSAPGMSSTAFQNASGLATRFDSGNGLDDGSGRSTVASASFTLDSQTTQAVAASSDAASDRERALSVTTSPGGTVATVGSAAALQLTLWNFINNVRAQQVGNQFQSLMASSANIDYTINGVPAPTPLPAASWLFLGGLAILAALQWHVRRGARKAARHRIPAAA